MSSMGTSLILGSVRMSAVSRSLVVDPDLEKMKQSTFFPHTSNVCLGGAIRTDHNKRRMSRVRTSTRGFDGFQTSLLME